MIAPWLGFLRDGGRGRASVGPSRSALRALRDLVLAPPGEDASSPGASPAPARPPDAAALGIACPPDDVRAVAIAAGSLLAGRAGTACVVGCVWTATSSRGPQGRSSATGAARRMAAALARRGLAAGACGRVAIVTLPASPADAAVAARRAAAAGGDAPTVLVLGGPRDDTLDALLAEQDRVIVLTRPGEPPAVGELAVSGLAMLGVPASAAALGLGPAARALAHSGLVVPTGLRGALRAVLEDGR
jgi:hypothetical protein